MCVLTRGNRMHSPVASCPSSIDTADLGRVQPAKDQGVRSDLGPVVRGPLPAEGDAARGLLQEERRLRGPRLAGLRAHHGGRRGPTGLSRGIRAPGTATTDPEELRCGTYRDK